MPDGSYSVSNNQDYFEYIYNIKTGYDLELSTPEIVKWLGRTENKIAKNKNAENVLHPEITEVVLVHCNIVSNDYQKDSRVL